MNEILAYNLKLKKKVKMDESKAIEFKQNKNGSFFIKGYCSETGSVVTTIMGKDNGIAAIEAGRKKVDNYSF